MIRAQWRVCPQERTNEAFEAVTLDLDDGGTSRALAIELFTSALDREIAVGRRARELARENS